MIEIGVNKLTKYYGTTKIFENVSFELHSNEIIGLVGHNGSGKTTLMKVLMGDEDATGDIFIKKDTKVSYLNQIPNYENDETTQDVLYKALKDIQGLRKRLTELEHEMAKADESQLELIMKRYSECLNEYEIAGGYDIEENLSKIVTGLQLESFINTPFKQLSGGEKTRVMLGKVLLENPDVLLLDEPTNHLDLTMLNWLEDYLRKYNGAAIVISHDRYFLDHVVSKIIELQSNGLELYHGNYSYYKIEKEKRFEISMKEYDNQQKKIKTIKEQIRRYRIWGEMRDSEDMYKRAKELEKRLAKIDELDRPQINQNIKLNFTPEHRSGKRIYELVNVSKRYDNKVLFNDINVEILYQDCLAIIGDNGCGKSTLLNIIREKIEPDEGKLRVGARLKVGYLSQEIAFEDENLSILKTYQNNFDCTSLKARNALAKVLFKKDDVFKKINQLSGGEKVRLKLLMLMNQLVNVLLLDEPTNHLDIESREILENSLYEFNGTIIVISHDRYFINKLANRIAEIKHQQFHVYEGDFDYYINEKQKEKKQELEKENNKEIKKPNPKKEKKTLSPNEILELIEKKEKELENSNERKHYLRTEIEQLYQQLEKLMEE